ncbi:MAG: hypothetical protein ACOYON_02545 [Fimbriimonas sp.]
MSRLRVFAGCLLMASSVAHAQTGWRFLDDKVLRRISGNGERRLGYHIQNVTGDFEAFQSLTYQGLGGQRFTNTGSLTLTGNKVADLINFQVTFSENQFSDPQQQRFTLNLDRGPWSVTAGDIFGTLLNTNSLLRFGRSLKGVGAGYKKGKIAVRALRTETKGAARTISLEGANTTGPYFLQSGRIVADSVDVRVDGSPKRLLYDFVVDADQGTITFVEPVSSTSTITVTYETFGFNTQSGTIEGAGLTYNLGRYGRVGISGLRQVGSSVKGDNSRIESFQGFGEPSIPYFLQFRPVTGSVVVKVNGIIQTQGPASAPGGDYYFDPANVQTFYFKRFVPSTQTITVTYQPEAEKTLDGDRRVWGIDYRYPLSKDDASYIQYSQALGELLNPANPLSGVARTLEASWREKTWVFRGTVKDIPGSYVTVESTGFKRNEKGYDLTLENQAQRFSYGASASNSSIVSRVSTGTTFATRNSRSTEASLFTRYSAPGGIDWNLRQTRRASRTTDESRIDATELSARKSLTKNLNLRFGAEYQSGQGLVTYQNVRQPATIVLTTLKTTLSYLPTSEITVSGNFGITQTRAFGEAGAGNDYAFNVDYSGKGRWTSTFSARVSRAGQFANLGFDNGTGSGYADSGFNSGSLGDGLLSVGGTNVRRYSLSSAYRASDRLRLRTNFFDSQSLGSFSSNSRSVGVEFGSEWDLGGFTLLDASLSNTNTTFLSTASTGKSESTVLDLYLRGTPNKFSYGVGFNTLISGGQSDYKIDSTGINANLSYRLAARQTTGIYGNWGRTRGYAPQDDRTFGAFYRYNLFSNVSLDGRYTWRNVQNLDPAFTTGAYRSSGFDFELVFDLSGALLNSNRNPGRMNR